MSIWKTLEQADKLATLEINSWNSTFTDPIWAFISDIPVWIPMYVAIIAFIIYKRGWKKGLIVVGGAVLTADYAAEIGAHYYAKDASATVAAAKEVFGK